MFIIESIMGRVNKKEKMIDSGPIVISPNQLSMFPDYGVTVPTPPRPNKNTLDKEPLYETITRLVMEWAEEGEDTFQDYLKITKNIFDRGNFHDDAYELARAYEKARCQPDVDLVKLLDDVGSLFSTELRKQVIGWVKTYAVDSIFNIGDKVYRENAPSKFGSVRAVYCSTAEIGVNWNALNDSISILPQEYFTIKA